MTLAVSLGQLNKSLRLKHPDYYPIFIDEQQHRILSERRFLPVEIGDLILNQKIAGIITNFTLRVPLRVECSDPIRFGGAHAVILKLTYLTFRSVSGKQWRAATRA
jgi:hypothetical protein